MHGMPGIQQGDFDLGRPTRARLAALAQALCGTVFLKLRSGVESVCLARHDGAGPVPSLMLEVGGRRPLRRSRPLGYASNLGDIAAGINAIGVPLSTPAGTPVASLTLALAGAPLSQPQADTLAARLHTEAEALAPLLVPLRLGQTD